MDACYAAVEGLGDGVAATACKRTGGGASEVRARPAALDA